MRTLSLVFFVVGRTSFSNDKAMSRFGEVHFISGALKTCDSLAASQFVLWFYDVGRISPR